MKVFGAWETRIEHLRGPGTGERLLRLDYEYLDNDLPWRITEYGAGPMSTPTVQAVTTFNYDRRNSGDTIRIS